MKKRRPRLPEDQKIALLEEFDALPHGVPRLAWLKERVPEPSRFYQWRKKYLAKQAVPTATGKGLFASASREEKLRMVQEYDSLPHAAERRAWKERNLNQGGKGTALLTYYRLQFKREGLLGNGHSTALVPVQHLRVPHVLPQASPAPVVTLEDACAAMQVRIDIYNECLDHFKRMLKGGR